FGGPAIVIEVRDAITGGPAACGAVGQIQSGEDIEVLTELDDCASQPDALVLEGGTRAGTYTVTLTKSGYQTWVLNDVVVRSARCGLVPTHLSASLLPV